MNNKTVSVELDGVAIQYIMAGLEALNTKGASLQDSANIINTHNYLGEFKAKLIKEAQAEAEAAKASNDSGKKEKTPKKEAK